MLKLLFRYFLLSLLLFYSVDTYSQKSIFDDTQLVELIKSGADHIYGRKKDSAQFYIDRVKAKAPHHPIVPMMEAVRVLWYHIPVLEDEVFENFNQYLLATVTAAQNLPEDNPDAVFFEMSARGLLAEYYADRGAYMKAFSEASQAYSLLKEGFDYVDEYPEYLFAVGLYNYFREAYPERHPIYKPLIWFFKSGNKELGLQQLIRATKETVIIRVEAYVYLSYIFLRYEEKPQLSQQYTTELYQQFPQNPYVQAKYLESNHANRKFKNLMPEITYDLKKNEAPYYRLVGNLYGAIYAESVLQNMSDSFDQYQVAYQLSEELPGYADYYKSLIHLGLGRIYKQKGQNAQAANHLELAISHAQTKDVLEEANRWINQ